MGDDVPVKGGGGSMLVMVAIVLQVVCIGMIAGVLASPAPAQVGLSTASEAQIKETLKQILGNASKPIVFPPTFMPKEGPIGSVKPSTGTRPHIIMGMDVDYPPYAYTRTAPYSSSTDLDEVVGVGADMIKAMGELCGFDVTITQAHWKDCWGAGEIGAGLREGWYHGCMTYTHAAAVRNRYLDFTNSWAIKNKPSGLITSLDGTGKPHIKGTDDLSGKIIVDVTGWAPTADTLYFVKNQCTDKSYGSFTVVQGDQVTLSGSTPYGMGLGPNDRALIAVLEGKADAMWIYGDQAANYQCAVGTSQPGWNCALWGEFGKKFAYVQSGMFSWMHNGTTVAISKKGSGLNELLDPCLDKFMKTKKFAETCKINHGTPAHNQLQACVPNSHILADSSYKAPDIKKSPYMFATKDMAAGGQACATGYCNCNE